MSLLLTKLRTNQITKLVSKGYSKSEIAEQLGINVNSVTYWYRKINIKSEEKDKSEIFKMNKNNGIKVCRVTIHRKECDFVVYKNVYIKIKPDAIDISDREDFMLLYYFLFSEIEKFEIVE